MSNSSTVCCCGYLTAPLVEACRERGLFRLLDSRRFRDRAWLIRELGANAGYFTIALEALASHGLLEKNGQDAYRSADGDPEQDLTPVNAVEIRALSELLFGDSARALREIRDGGLLRAAVSADAGAELQQQIVEIFDREPLEEQPDAVVDVQCGDGRLLEKVYRTIRSKTARGSRLAERPVRLIGVDDDRRNLDATAATLAGLPHQVVLAERNRAEERSVALQQAGVTSERKVLHLHHLIGSTLRVNADQPVNEALAVLAAGQAAHYVDRDGRLLDAPAVLTAWQQHLRALAQSVGQSRLVVLETHGDWIQRIAQEYPIGAEAFIVLAASVGLFHDGRVKRYPRSSDPCRISLHGFTNRDYVIRHAVEADLDRLCELEELCWQHTQTPRERILARLQTYPQGQFVLEKDGKVLGVIYSQRIAGADALMTRTAADVHELHDVSGSIIQLLAVNLDPQTQNAGYGDQLLEFMLQRCGLVTGIERVVGVTLCKRFDAAQSPSFEDYIRLQGSSQDPVLAFHHAHGAEIVRAVPGYRPEDRANLHNGVLVAYDILDRPERRQQVRSEQVRSEAPRVDRRQIEQFVRNAAARLLAIAEGDLDADRPVMEMGLDSADLLKLQRLCEERFGIQLQAGFFFEYSSIRKVIDHLAGRLAASEEAPVSRAVAVEVVAPIDTERVVAATDIAVVGMACRLPGGIETPDDFWRVLSSNECVIGSFPAERRSWPTGAEYPGIDQGGFVADVDAFDAAFFRISPAEAQITDPQQRILLQLAWACLEDAGILPAVLKGSKTGVFVGASNCDYSRLVQEAGLEIEAHNGVGSSLAILANRISYFFDLSGPSLVVDTACSSSLVALHSAVQSLRSGECAAALVGGVNLICHPDLSIAYHKAGMLAPDGRCKVFDASANGYVRSEGSVLLMLKPLRAAIADGNRVHAVIRGSATNHGGLAGGLTVPNPQKQKELLLAAWKDAGIAARDLSYIEAHGTGTSLGDPIEIQGMQAAIIESGAGQPGSCAVGSAKSNLGHLESAAGITGLLKVILSFRHRQLPASVNFSQLNPKIRLSDTPLVIQDRLRAWDAAQPRLAAVSSFGSGGANAHVVVQEYADVAAGGREEDAYLFVLSAASEERLHVHAGRVVEWLGRKAVAADFAGAIYTWQAGRTAMKHRLAIKVTDRLDLLNKLQQWLAGNADVADLWTGHVGQKDSSVAHMWQTKSGRQLIEQAVAGRDVDALGPVWAAGIDIDWAKFYEVSGERTPRPVSVPTYPFARERYWIEATAVRPRAIAAASVIHPLLHTNTSNLSQQSYSATFTGEEFFLSDHQVRADGRSVQKVLPGVAYLEMTRAAIEHALPARPESTVLELQNTVWVQPIVVTEARQVRIALSADDDDQIDFEVSSEAGVHCQGIAVLSQEPAPARLDLEQLRGEMQERVEANAIYAAFSRMGLVYGPAFQALTAIQRGSGQLLATLRVPQRIEGTAADYILHPSVVDGAVQAAVGLIDGWSGLSREPRLPFALESLRIVSPCTAAMVAWVRFAPGSQAGDKVVKVDIDLCDELGNVCIQLHGFSSRVSSREVEGSLLAHPVWEAADLAAGASVEYAQHHVIEAPALSENVAEGYSAFAVSCFEKIQDILRSKPQGKVLVQIAVTGDEEQQLLAGLSGLLKTAALENPQIVGQLIEQGVPKVLRWREIEATTAPIAFKSDGIYLITGGTGGLGLLFAREILEKTRDARVILTGRSPKQSLPDDRMIYRQVDLEDLAQVEQLIAGIQREHGRLDGILHCAGMIADGFILRKTSAQFREVLAPKVTGTVHLDQASKDVELDFFVLFSSINGAMGNVGQADYATANGFMDQFAAHRNRQVAAGLRHGRTRSINWPLWQAGGMNMDAASLELMRRSTGQEPMRTATGLEAFHRILALPYDQVLVVEGDLARMRRTLLDAPDASVPQVDQPAAVAELAPDALFEKTQEYLRQQFSGVLKLAAHKIDPQAALEEYGIDSMLAMKLTGQLEETFGSLSKTLFFEYQTIRELTKYFADHYASQLTALLGIATTPVAATPVAAQVVPPPAHAGRRFKRTKSSAPSQPAEFDAIAIVGLSGRYPEAANLDAYWSNLSQGKDCIIEVPKDRWDWREYFSEDRNSGGHHYSKWGGFIAGVDEFDPLFFNISPRDATYIDPQERLFLQHAWMAVEDAGYTRATLQVPAEQDLAGQVGVYVGVMWSEYQLFGAEASVHDLRMGFAGNLASIANRVSYALNLHGPSMTLDTMCSSSLTAIHVACQDLKMGRTSLAIAGGVNVSIHPNKYLMLSIGQFISSDGHCQSFGEGGDGYIPGEGVGVVVLKRLSDAKRDGDHIYGVIRGSSLTHGGKTNGYTVPNPQAQASAISRALSESKVDARHVSYVEAHGTGTKLGDPIEIAALGKAFQQYTQDAGFCLIGSAKSNIGHCESAAGIAGLTKVLLQMQHQQIVPSLHSAQLNPHIDFAKSPFVVNQSLKPWEQPVLDGRKLPRIAGISSFGAGGSNAHMIVEEYQAPVQQPVTSANVVILLSARTVEQLQQKASDLLDFVRARRNAIDLVAMAYTLQVGREAMEERLGLVVSSTDELVRKLEAYVAGEQAIEEVYQGQVKRNKEAVSVFSTDADLQQTVDKWIANGKLSKLVDLWVKGLEVEWSRLYGQARPQRISVPTYPFARERYWIDTASSKHAAANAALLAGDSAALHPLLHSNTSDLSEQRFRSTFTGEEFFLADHQLAADGEAGRKVLPGVVYLEMARAAIEHALPAQPGSPVLELRNTVWAQPIVVTDKAQVNIALLAEDDEQIDYEIYSQDMGQRLVHCQGSAVLSGEPAPAALDLGQLTAQMTQGLLEADAVYADRARMGLLYGPSFQGITSIQLGAGQVLAQLRLPAVAADSADGYVLHPSLMDGALQAAVGLLEDGSESAQPRLPFALDTLRIVAPCAAEMVAWARYAPGSKATDKVVKLDIDLCDEQGNVCVQLHGLSTRVLSKEIAAPAQAIGSLLANPVWETSNVEASAEAAFAEHHVIDCRSVEASKTIAQNYSDHALASFERIRTILQSRPQGKVLVQIVVPDEGEQALLAGLSGLLKTAALENPQLAGQIILVAADVTAEDLARYLEEEKNGGLEPLVRYADGVRQVLRWKDIPAEATGATDKPPVAFKDEGVYLITGGLGGLGVLFAKEILEQTRNARVVLTGRSALSARRQALLSSQLRRSALHLDAPAARLSYRQVDLGDLDQVRRLIAGVLDECGRLDGILHCAGMTADAFILKKTAAEFAQVLAPKVAGTFHLDEASRDVALDFFVLFSSTTGALGNLGQADYATANGFMDQFAAHRNRQVTSGERHGRTRSINWPLWQSGGMGLDRAGLELLQQTTGMRPMQTATGMQAFHRSLALPYDQVLVVEGDLTQVRRVLAAGRPIQPERTPLPAAAAEPIAADGDLAEKTEEYLKRQFSGVLRLAAQKIDPQAALEEYGIDSVLAMQLTNQLEQTFGSLSKTLIFEYHSVRELSRYFLDHHAAQLAALFAAPASVKSEAPAQTKAISGRRYNRPRNVAAAVPASKEESDAIAIVGLSGRYPGANDVDAYWRNLRDGKDSIVEVPKERWDWEAHFSGDRAESGRHYSKWGGFIEGVDEFDPQFFHIAPKEAKYIDPQERLFLQHAWQAIEDAGYTRAALQIPQEGDLPGQVGVYVGVMWSEYQLYGAMAGAEDVRMGFAGNLASIANRVSYALNIHGPSMTLDTMCSSSLTAIHIACEDLKHGRTSLAIAGGVNVSVHPHKYLLLSVGQFISSDGHCQSFGEGGDGYIPGEGVGAVVLKRLSDAKRDGDHIYGVIRGSALTHGGKTNGYTVPNPQAQASAINRALAESKIEARHISYIEAHGTGTKLGDPIEIAALSKSFHQSTQDNGFCLIGSAKSNIGHCESAAGIAGLTKILLQMQHQQIVPSLHSAQLNPHIDFGKSPFIVNQTLRPWEQPVIEGKQVPRIAGLSSFGAGGSNAHMIVEEYPAPAQQPVTSANVVILLSARTPEQLQRKASDLLEFVRARAGAIDLPSVAYTLQVGREAMEERLAIVVTSVEDLAQKLQAYVAGDQAIEDAYQGQVKRNREALSLFSSDGDLKEAIEKWIANGKLSKLADLWVKGLELDWSRLYSEGKLRRISLPAYPFARERYWIDVPVAKPVVEVAARPAVLHPLLHSNVSDLNEQRYRSTFTGDEPLPAAYLEMARAAIDHAMPRPEATVLELRDVVFAQPIAAGKREVGIALSPAGPDQIEYEIYSDDVVLCQGRAVWHREGAAELRAVGDYVLIPNVLNDALKAAVAIDSLRIVSPCTAEMVANVRSADVDVCDAQGNVAVQMRGVQWEEAAVEVAEPVVIEPVVAPVAVPALVRREIVLQAQEQTIAAPVQRKKRGAIALDAPEAAAPAAVRQPKPSITLSNTTVAAPTASPVRLYDRGDGVFSIEIAASRTSDMIGPVLQALDRAQQDLTVKVLLLGGIEHCFPRGGRDEYNDAVEQKLFRSLAAFPYPVIATLQGDVIGAGLLAAALCDFMVCNEDAQYGYTEAGFYPSLAEAALFGERFGQVRANELLFGSPSTGRQLRAKGWTTPVLPWEKVETHAEQLAFALATKSRDALRLLKQHLTRGLSVNALARVEAQSADASNEIAIIRYSQPIADLSRYKAVVLVGEDIADEAAADLQRLILDAEIPFVAALPGDARGNAWLIAQLCDACVYSKTGIYSAADVQTAVAVFAHRLGNDAASEILLSGADYSGADLHERAGVSVADDVLSAAEQIAASWAALPRTTLAAWKSHSAATLRETIRRVPDQDDDTSERLVGTVPQSRVVTVTAHPDGVAVVKLEDREAKNMFSDAFVAGVAEAFAHIESNPSYKVVVLTGYDHYFASGGTKETLLAIQKGTAKFTDAKVFQAALDCRLPVIAAMQGHGIGAGWSMGMFADVALLSEESRYVSPYMGYGFTPGAGATLSLAEKMGQDLARESLLTAQQVSGRELKDRGVALRVLPRAAVVEKAMELAGQIARAPRQRLIGLKQQLAERVRLPLEETYRLELAMHEKTFVGRSDTLARIEESFREEKPAVVVDRAPAGRSGDAVSATLKTLLANELQLPESSVDDHAQFVDLGLDSISGVTWIRKINEKYGTSIEATKVYSYPTLAQLSRYVQEEAARRRPAGWSAAGSAAVVRPSAGEAGGAPWGDVPASLKTLLANELQLQESSVDDHAQFVDLGLDSISGVTWIRKINEKYGTSIEATKVYSYPSLAQLSRYVKEEAEKRGTLPAVEAPVAPSAQAKAVATERRSSKTLTSKRNRKAARFATAAAETRTPQPIAVIGMAGQFPQAANLDEFWRNIAEGRNCITPVPAKRWDVNAFYQPGEAAAGKTTSQWAGTLDGHDQFDPLFFNISPTEAENMDPQQRLFLQACWHSIENAGYDARALSGSKTGVFVGCASGDYHQRSREHQLSAQGFTGSATSILAARISYFLNLQGPCVSIDTACSSSLVSLANACDSLTSGASDLALAGGVYVMTGPEMHIKTSQAGMLSPDGKCYTFDQRANGFVPGEGVGVVMLKRLADAERDGDIIHAVIHGWGVNQDGKTNGITAPNPESQTRLEQGIYDQFGIDPANIQLIEAHGTGTKLGDPIEVEGLRNAFRKYTQSTEYCALGSVKSNIGHCLTAAGIAGVLKLVLALKHRQLPPTINFERLNEHIDLKESPFYVNGRLREWESGAQGRQAATSSFGFSGTNAHIVIGEYASPAAVAQPVAVVTQDGRTIVPLSAKTAEQLDEKARELLAFLRGEGRRLDLVEIAYTLQVGREPMEERLGVLAGSVDELAARLESYVAGKARIEGLVRGKVKRVAESTSILSEDDDVKETIVAKWIANRKLSKLLEAWVIGLELDWNQLYGEVRPRRIPLPAYPFAKERYWIEASDAPVAVRSAVLHPLLHRNASELGEQRYSSTFTGEEFFLDDHRVRTNGCAAQKLLPGVAYLEMARAAIRQASPRRSESSILELRGTVWLKPAAVTESKEVSISLFAADGDRADFEVSSADGGQETVHCQGQAVFSREAAPARVDLEQLRRQMGEGRLNAAEVYGICGAMGLEYGPAHQGITALHLGRNQLLADLRLPAVIEASEREFVLHPSLMDSALQASIGLLVDPDDVPTRPLVPFAVESVRIISACTREMTAWVRHAKGKVDADLCDRQGNVCVQIRGFASRAMDDKPTLRAVPDSFDDAFYESLIADVMNGTLSVEDAVAVG